jgi:OmpA-OmpF porin, OOP family
MQMKKLIAILCFVGLFISDAEAQILRDILNHATQKVVDKTNEKIDKAIDNSGKNKKKDSTTTNKNPTEANSTTNNNEINGVAPEKESLQVYAHSKFDFIPGEKIIAVEDFERVPVGDFPDKWNTTTSGEVVTVDGSKGKWLQLLGGSGKGYFTPEFINNLPENFTFEFDLLYPAPKEGASFADLEIILQKKKDGRDIYVQLKPSSSDGYIYYYDWNNNYNYVNVEGMGYMKTFKAHIALWRIGKRLKVYWNEKKMLDVPNMMDTVQYKNIAFTHYTYKADQTYIIGNLKFAEGKTDTRQALLTKGKYVTRGILFDINADNIKPQSLGTIKELATILTENPELKIKIIGHTDSDGEDAKNLWLSQKRAIAVKTILEKEFNIDATRMSTDGKGEKEPLSPNTNAEGKANNRRVEFIKL